MNGELDNALQLIEEQIEQMERAWLGRAPELRRGLAPQRLDACVAE